MAEMDDAKKFGQKNIYFVVFQQIRVLLQNLVDDLHLSARLGFDVGPDFRDALRSRRRRLLQRRLHRLLGKFLLLHGAAELVDRRVQAVSRLALLLRRRGRRRCWWSSSLLGNRGRG